MTSSSRRRSRSLSRRSRKDEDEEEQEEEEKKHERRVVFGMITFPTSPGPRMDAIVSTIDHWVSLSTYLESKNIRCLVFVCCPDINNKYRRWLTTHLQTNFGNEGFTLFFHSGKTDPGSQRKILFNRILEKVEGDFLLMISDDRYRLLPYPTKNKRTPQKQVEIVGDLLINAEISGKDVFPIPGYRAAGMARKRQTLTEVTMAQIFLLNIRDHTRRLLKDIFVSGMLFEDFVTDARVKALVETKKLVPDYPRLSRSRGDASISICRSNKDDRPKISDLYTPEEIDDIRRNIKELVQKNVLRRKTPRTKTRIRYNKKLATLTKKGWGRHLIVLELLQLL
jgi:hypothetical protein